MKISSRRSRAPRFASPWHCGTRFCETDCLSYLCISRKRKSVRSSSFRVFGANYPIGAQKLSYMALKIISKIVKICSLIVFPKCFEVKFCLIFAEIFPEQIFAVLIIPKLLSKPALTIVNAPLTLCAARNAALTSFAFLLASS